MTRFWLLGAASVIALALLAHLRGGWQRPGGDEPTYLAMAESLALDGDVAFGEADRSRVAASQDEVILQLTASGLFYSKPVLYPLLGAPFVRILGRPGLVVLNLLALAAGLAAAWTYLRRAGPADRAALTLVTFAGAGVLPVYAAWLMSEALQCGLALCGLVLCLGGAPSPGSPAPGPGVRVAGDGFAAAAGGACLGLLAGLRYPNILLAVGAVAALVWIGRRRRALAALASAALFLLLSLAANRLLIGSAEPYTTLRTSFNAGTGYPGEADEEAVHARFAQQDKSRSLALEAKLTPDLTAYSALYFLVGRHTGVLVYFPATLALLLAASRGRDRVSWTLLAAVLGLVLFYLVLQPRNYFGGAAFVGNRYFLPAYCALLVAARRPPGRPTLIAAWTVAVLAFGSALVSTQRSAELESSSQVHAYAGIFRLLPYESTARDLEGRRDRYWSDEFLRFADPYPRVGRWGFELDSRHPDAEVMLATTRSPGVLRFLVEADAPRVEIVYRDWRRQRVVPVGPAPGEQVARGVVEIEPAASWRRHRFPWQAREPWRARVFRLAVRSPGGEPTRAELRFLGPYRLLRKFFSHQILQAQLPLRAEAGTETRLRVQARNSGRRPWEVEAAVPVLLRYRFERGSSGRWIPGRFTRLRRTVERGEVMDEEMRIRWPRRPGVYMLTVDLVLAGTVWFEQIGGVPLARGEVLVVAE